MYGGRKGYKRKGSSYKGGKSFRFAKKRRSTDPAYGSRGLLRPGGNKYLYSNPLSSRPAGGSSGNHASVSVARGLSWFPDRLRLPLKFTVQLGITINSGVGAQGSLIANSIFDPSGSIGATQPYGYDQLAAIYSQYVVLASSIQAQAITSPNSSSTNNANNIIQMAVWPHRTSTSAVSDFESARQAPYGKTITLNAVQPQFQTSTLRNYISTAKTFGVPAARVQMDDLFSGPDMTSSPGNTWYWNICVVSPSAAAALTTTILVEIEMIQYTELFSLKWLAST